MIDYFSCESLNKYQIVKYMQQDQNISKLYNEDIILLEMESIYWGNLANQTLNLKETVINNSFFKLQKESKLVIDTMTEIISNIIKTEEMIILTNEK